jgi:hypothetical protein
MVGIFLSLVTSTMYASLQQTIAQTTTTATKTTNSNTFLTYENNSTLGVKIQYPDNWQRSIGITNKRRTVK